MREVVLASGNPGKLKELGALLADVGLRLRSQAEFQVPECPETGLSFVENAILKARNAARCSGLAAVADDSGLEVDALNGAPGIYSARYAADQIASGKPSDIDNLEKLLRVLSERGLAENHPGRVARFQSVVAYLRHADDPSPLIAQGTWLGRIALAPKGDNGFGYDPIFYVPELGRTAAELAAAEKNRFSHRAKALVKLKQALIDTDLV